MEVEEEPLLPLMRNRRSKTRSRWTIFKTLTLQHFCLLRKPVFLQIYKDWLRFQIFSGYFVILRNLDNRPPRIPSTLPTPVAKDKTVQVRGRINVKYSLGLVQCLAQIIPNIHGIKCHGRCKYFQILVWSYVLSGARISKYLFDRMSY